MSDERKEFEKWARTKFGRGQIVQASNGPYVWDDVQEAWTVWQARARLASAPSASEVVAVPADPCRAVKSAAK